LDFWSNELKAIEIDYLSYIRYNYKILKINIENPVLKTKDKILETEEIENFTEKYQELIAKNYEGVSVDSWHNACLESFGLKQDKLVFDEANLEEHFDKHGEDLLIHTQENYQKWIELVYKSFFDNNNLKIIAPNLKYHDRLELFDLENKQILVVAFDQNDNQATRFVTFHNKDDPNSYKRLLGSGLVTNIKIQQKIQKIIDSLVLTLQRRQNKQSESNYVNNIRNSPGANQIHIKQARARFQRMADSN
jgi:hypothetical protein